MDKDILERSKNIGFISTRIEGLDGVSLETKKWVGILEEEGFSCYFLAGKLDMPEENSMTVDRAFFNHPEIKEMNEELFGKRKRAKSMTERIHIIKNELKESIYDFIEEFDISLLIAENCLSIPMNIPLGIALTEVIAETQIPTIGHHHDFFWERKRFLSNSVWDYLNMSFPPNLPSIKHVVINSSADNQLSLRTGISAEIIPNIMNFEKPPPKPDEYTNDIKESFEISEDELLILQPTRVVQRKGIEKSIELVKRLNRKAKLIISHASGDEGSEYERRIREYSELLGVNTIFESDRISSRRGETTSGEKIYSIWDVYPHSDLITYPSNFEGFGNAFLEAIYYKKPVVVNNYSIYLYDIKPKGFKVIELEGYVNRKAINKTKKVLDNEDFRKKMVEYNFKLAKQYYSFSILRRKLLNIIYDFFLE